MPQIEAEPPPDLGPNLHSIFRTFDGTTNKLKGILENRYIIEDVIGEFTKKSSPLSESVARAIESMRLASKERKFTLTPLIAKYSKTNEEKHQIQKLLTSEKNIDHVFVNPISGAEDVYYHYILYIPIPEDLIRLEDPKKLIRQHWEIVFENIPPKFNNLIKEFEPLYIIGRVFGWDGAWLAYAVTVIDKKDIFWSMPLVKSPYNGTQPYLGVREGEFAVLENDGTDISKRKVKASLIKIEERARENSSIEFERGKSIEVAPEWIIANDIYSNNIQELDFKKSSFEVGSKLGPASIENAKEFSDSRKMLEFMKKEVIGRPLYEFSPEEIGNCLIHRKL